MEKFRKTIIQTVFIGIFIVAAILNVSFGQAKVDKLDKLVHAYVEYGKFNGSVLVAEKGKIIYKKGFGFADMEWNIPNLPDTKFRLGSITKQFTSMLIMQLVEQGKLKLDVPISTYLPDYPKKTGDIITIHHLLTHSSGIPNMTSFPGFSKVSRNSYSPLQLVNLFADSTLQFEPGKNYAYSNSGYILLGYIIEKVTGKSYEQVLQENIFTPLKMNNTGYDHRRTLLKNRASGYEKSGWHYVNANFLDMSVPYAAGSMYSTVEDLYLWNQALYADQLLRQENKDLLFTKHIPAGGNSYYGYGWGIGEIPLGNTAERVATIGHGGGIDGFNTQITRIPSDKSFIVLLNNTGGAPLNEMTNAIAAILYDKTYNLPKRSVAYSLAERTEKQGMRAGLQYFDRIKDSTGYYLDENEMNRAGYEFLQSGKVKEATAVFKLNTKAFPKSSNVYDSYGEALMVSGDKTAAIENYKQAVKLNPGNEYAIKTLKENGINTDDLIKKVPIEYLKLLQGEYLNVDNKDWKIKFEVAEGILYGNDRGYKYKVLPVGEGEFVNPDDGASLVFDTKDKSAITMVLFGRAKFRKVL
jgi:CubicO group peptidase (beta-lactamase class C family)